MPSLIIFDLDQTLAESKQAITPRIADLLTRLLTKTRVAVISGGGLPQFSRQIIDELPEEADISHLYLLPTSGSCMYEWKEEDWQTVHEVLLSQEEVAQITEAIHAVATETGLVDFSVRAWGDRIQNRESQITFSALGQDAPLPEKQAWDPDKSKRRLLQIKLAELLPAFSVGMGGATSVDITRKGVDKAFGIRTLGEHLSIPLSAMLYVGDQLEAGGNDEPALATGVPTRAVKNPEETARVIEELLH